MKNAFYFTLKALLVLNIFKFLSWLFGHVEKRLDEKDNVNLKIHDVITWLTNHCNTHIDQYLKKWRQSDYEIWSVNRIKREKKVSWKIIYKMWWRNYSQILLWKTEIEYTYGSKFLHNFVFIVSKVEDYRKILKLSCRPLAFTSYKAS